MAQLFFKYGAMNSGKTIEILTSGLDTREGVGNISSRIGLSRPAVPIFSETNIFDFIKSLDYKPYCILIDESQFLSKEHVVQLAQVVDELDIPVMAFGLKNDFRNEMFEGSKYLLLYADKLEELKTICWFCHKKATMNLHYIDGRPVYEGDQVQIGGNEAYYPVCRKHYLHPEIEHSAE
jgi:thymidine kinase